MKKILINMITVLVLAVSSLALPAVAFAAGPSCGHESDAKGQVLQGVGNTGGNCSDEGVNSVLSAVVNILSIIVGVAAVIVIVISGLRFITSGGESGKVAAAKNGLIYALVGLIIAALAQVIVHFVLFRSSRG